MTITKGVYTVSNFFRPDECEKFIIQGEEKGFEEATISFPQQPKMMKSVRNNDRVTFESVDLADALFPRIAPHLHQILPNENADSLNPRFRFYRYFPGQRFKRHIDGTVKSNDLESKLTFLIYLNDDCGGGETIFRPRGVPEGGEGEHKIAPAIGKALLFEHHLWHEGAEIEHGVKYVLRTDVFYKTTE